MSAGESFYARMQAAKQAKRERASRGESAGAWSRELTATERKDRDGDKLTVAFAKLRCCFNDFQAGIEADLFNLALSDRLGDCEIPF